MKRVDPIKDTKSIRSRQTRWISSGIETLVNERPWVPGEGKYDFDDVIVGRAIAAGEMNSCTDENEQPWNICVLARDREYLASAVPFRQADLAEHVRLVTRDAPRQCGDVLYDIRWSEDAVVMIASGLGRGSLMNAGVMERVRQVEKASARNHFEGFLSTLGCFLG